MKRDEAARIAQKWVERIRPYCQRVEIAGSLRRGKPEVKDIEIVAEPKINQAVDLFGQPVGQTSQLDVYLSGLTGVRFVKAGPKYKQIALPEGIKLDLFVVTPPAQWGVIMAIRTGPADYSRWLVTQRRYNGPLPSNLRVKDGAVWNGTKIVPTPEESDFFAILGLANDPPELRQVPHVVGQTWAHGRAFGK